MKTQLPPKWAQHPLLFGPCLLWQNDWMDQDANWYGCRPRSRPHCVRWGPSFPQRGTTAPNFDPCLVWLNSWMDQDANWYGGSTPPPERGTAPSHFGLCLLWPNGWMYQDVNWHGCRSQPRPHCVRWGPSSSKGAHSPSIFGPCLVWLNSWMDQDANWYGGSPPSERGTAALHFWAHVYCGQTIAHLSYCSALAICYWLLNELPAASFGGLGSNDPKK